ncbi:MAG TPA: hypothetical protein VNO51_24725 [Ilumatobacteraceae bacterium]|nr:hypothetical protein [Ilumatobacteraceae bacterium]
MEQDPFELLGIDPSSTVDDVHRARRRLAMRAHPDHGGDPGRMQAINAAVDAALIALSRPPPEPSAVEQAGEEPVVDDTGRGRWRRVATDNPSFTVEALPVETFEALVVVANWMGEVHVEDPPYVLETHLVEPFDCWCRLDIVPDAGASTVSIVVATFGDDLPPDVDAVRDAWVANLNQLDWGQLDGTQSRPS